MKKLFVMLALAVLISSHLFGHSLMKAMANEQEIPALNRFYTSIQIQKGESLWTIASQYAKDSGMSTTDYICELKRMNGLREDTIHAGQYLTVVYFAEDVQP